MTSTTTIVDRYELEGRLGVGGMSTVHLAFDRRLERRVAVKLLAEHLADDPAFVSRFRREALSAARLVHPNIVQVFDFGFDEGSHQHFIVMEHVPGQSCAELLRDRGHLDVGDAVSIITQACRGLDYAHRHGVVHRDVKPGNLLVSDSEVVKLADFGIARATDQSSITQVGSVLGTAAYLSPEQARGEEAGPRADLYSLGVVAYQLLSGRLPYEATSLSELALRQQREAPRPLQDLNPHVSETLALAISMALSIDKESRPADALLLADAVERGAAGQPPFDASTPTAHLGTAAATRVVDDWGLEETAATRLAPAPPPRSGTARRDAGGGRTEPTRAVAAPVPDQRPRTSPRQVPARAPAASAATEAPRRAADRRPVGDRPQPRRRGAGRAIRRLVVLALLAVVFVVAVAVAAAIVTSTSTTVVNFRDKVNQDTQTAVHDLKNWIDQYTR
jgi:serine/threonine-protein kinase